MIKELRLKKSISQQDLADAIQVSKLTILNAEKGKRMSLRTVRKLADYFGVSTAVIRIKKWIKYNILN